MRPAESELRIGSETHRYSAASVSGAHVGSKPLSGEEVQRWRTTRLRFVLVARIEIRNWN